MAHIIITFGICWTEETGENVVDNSDMTVIAENFRDQAAKLVDMLDISIPVVAKLKVNIHYYAHHSFTFLLRER